MDDSQARIEALEREVADLRRLLDDAGAADADFPVALQERERLLSEAERIVHLGSWVWDTATDSIRWSDELYRIFGREPRAETPTVEGFFRGIHPDDVERVRAVAARALDSGRPEPVDFRVRRDDGSVREVHMEAAVVRKDSALRFVGTVLDVTDSVELERRLRHTQKMQALGTLAGGVAHDFNNYLQVILGYADRIAQLPGERGVVEASIVQIREAAKRCERLTRQLLAFGRHSTFSPELVELDGLVEELAPMLQTLSGERIHLRHVRRTPSARVRADRASLEQVLVNLVVNARDAMPRGGTVTIETDLVSVRGEDAGIPEGRYATLVVEDEGAGIPPEVLPRIFEPFFTTKPKGSGTGLGLSSVYGIVDQSGGIIRVDSQPGLGTRIRVYLPQASSDSPQPSARTADPRATVLVVEDQTDVRELVRLQLEEAGYRVFEAENGVHALRVLREPLDVDLVLTDVVMPELSGVGLARTLATERPSLPIVFVSGFSDCSVEDLPGPLLKKPFLREELLRLLEVTLRS